ncbi:MAG: 4'-phosphopantetheinyl transferase [Moritella sp.]|jgi:4'-phosphopantetheinyl transferase
MSCHDAFFSQQLRFVHTTTYPGTVDPALSVYLFDSNSIASKYVPTLAQHCLHSSELEVFSKRKQLQAQQEYTASRVLIKIYASHCLGYNYADLAVQFDEQDTCLKVFHKNQAIKLGCCISHSHGQVLIALTKQVQLLGVDLEWISTRRSLDKLAAHYYHAEELQACKGRSNAALYRIWTLKEALAKTIKQPIVKLIRDNVFTHCSKLNVRSGNNQDFDISIISDTPLPETLDVQVVSVDLAVFKQ